MKRETQFVDGLVKARKNRLSEKYSSKRYIANSEFPLVETVERDLIKESVYNLVI